MDSLLETTKKEKGINKILLGALAVGILVVAALIGILSLKPSSQQVVEQALEGAYREGAPEFAAYTRRIPVQYVEDRTTQSLTGLGTIQMSIGGTVRNNTDKTLSGLELKVGVVDSFDKVLKEKTVVVIPKQRPALEAGQSMPVQVVIEGFEKDSDRANVRWKVTAIKVQ